MTTARPKKQDTLQELKAGTVQRLSQQYLQASASKPAPKSLQSPIRYQPLAIPKTFKVESSASSSSHDKRSSPLPSSSFSQSRRDISEPSPCHARQQSAPQLFLRPGSPDAVSPTPPLSQPALLQPSQSSSTLGPSVIGFLHSKGVAGGLSGSSVGSEDSFVSALSHIDSPKDPGSPRAVPVWKQMLDAIEQEDRPELDRILHAFDFAIVIQTLVTWNLSNTDGRYRHDPDILLDAKELLGPTVDHLNLIQIACFLFNEELALDLLNFVVKASDELESKKILYEFMGKMWGDGNTTLHLASFLGMADLTKRLLDLGANVYKMNDRKYKPVDCADENTTRTLFLNLTEVVRYRRIGQESLPTSPTSEQGLETSWSSFKSLGHLRSTSTSTLPLFSLLDDNHELQTEQSPLESFTLARPASTLGISNTLGGLLISNPCNSQSQSAKNGSSSNSSQGGSSDRIDDLLLAESLPGSEQDHESILSPTVFIKEPIGTVPTLRTPESAFAKEQAQPGSLGLKVLESLSQASSPAAVRSRPKLRSYQSSPSIRLHVETRSNTESTSQSITKSKKHSKRVSFDPWSLMADASRTGDLALYRSMLAIVLEEGESGSLADIINHQSASRKLSSLHLASSYNHLALCRFLVESGASVNVADMEGWTPMHCAAAEGHLAVFELLVQEPDADLQAVTFDGEAIEDVVEEEDMRQRIIDILEAQSRG
ncbi:hypothetical protein EMPS_10331 [Entomortierella parvispora]|uniref:Uncharacterized protein n=1 Tax=Entomortierella parvispora TaxID=205924 RepID=A0A9P3HKL7_9FUNG|nr:hypothetical protein EMPS_10331 [Entomortierella parvispora]